MPNVKDAFIKGFHNKYDNLLSYSDIKKLLDCHSYDEMCEKIQSIITLKETLKCRKISSEELNQYESNLANNLRKTKTSEEAVTYFLDMDEQINYILNAQRDIAEDKNDLVSIFERAYKHSLFVWESFSLGLISLSTLQNELAYISEKYNKVLSLLPTINSPRKVNFIKKTIAVFYSYQEQLELEGPDAFLAPDTELLYLEDEKLPDSIRFDWYDDTIGENFMSNYCDMLTRKNDRRNRIKNKNVFRG